MLTPTLPPQSISLDVLQEKYCKEGEVSEHDIFLRVSSALASVEAPERRAEWEQRFYRNMANGAIGAGRIMSAGGTSIKATLINCFVQPVGDCIQGFDEDGLPGIYEALRESAETMRRGGGVGYDFSAIRPKGALVKGTQSISSGPCSYINVFDQSCATVESAGARRGAQMGVLRIDHPDVLEFITAKRTPGRWNNFNVSVAVTDDFMHAVENDLAWGLVHKAKPGPAALEHGAYQREDGLWLYRALPARELWDTIMKSAYDFAEPGILFMDTVASDNNLYYCESISACNPCAEQPLPAYGCCDLGPVILPRFVRHPFNVGGEATFDFAGFSEAVAVQVRALDNVLDVTYWPLPQQQRESVSKRRIGVGFTGLGNTLAMLGLHYGSEPARAMAARISECMRDAAYQASVALAIEKGPFPLFEAEKYLESSFARRLPEQLRERIRVHGLRNSHLLSIAPTGTVSLAFADNASNGIEPAFSWTYTRKKREADGSTSEYVVQDHAYRLYTALFGEEAPLPDYFVSALELSVQEHLGMLTAVQPFIDSAISKTVNIPQEYPYEDFRDLYALAWKAGLKGLATYRPNSILGSVLEELPAAEVVPEPAAQDPAPVVDPLRSVIEKRPYGALPARVTKLEYWTTAGKSTAYLVVSFLPVQLPDGGMTHRAVEFFMPVGQSGESQQWITATMRSLSLAARGGFLDRALEDLRKVAWDRGPVRLGTITRDDGHVVPRFHDSEVAAFAFALQELLPPGADALHGPFEVLNAAGGGTTHAMPANEPVRVLRPTGKKCPECHAPNLIRKDGCEYCENCGHIGSCG